MDFFFLFNFCTGYDCKSASKSPHNVENLNVIDDLCVLPCTHWNSSWGMFYRLRSSTVDNC